MNMTQRLGALDLSLFDWVESQTGIEDRKSLLAIQHAISSRGPYRYLEIGSFKGGTLQPHIVDVRCRHIVSIDPRPGISPDERFDAGYDYGAVSTDSMLLNLRTVPGADLDKVQTVESSSEDLAGGDYHADLCFIDGEHTDHAALRDARFCLRVIRGSGVIAFHDRAVIEPGIRQFLRESRGYRAYPLQTCIFVVEFGGVTIVDQLRDQLARPATGWLAASRTGGSLPILVGAELYRRVRRSVRMRTARR